MYGLDVKSFVTENKCKKCEVLVFEECYDICHKCCDILSLEFIYQHQNCIGPSKYEINYEKVVKEINELDMTRKCNDICNDWKVKLNQKKYLSSVSCNECGEYKCMKKSEKYPKNIFCEKWKFVEYSRKRKRYLNKLCVNIYDSYKSFCLDIE